MEWDSLVFRGSAEIHHVHVRFSDEDDGSIMAILKIMEITKKYVAESTFLESIIQIIELLKCIGGLIEIESAENMYTVLVISIVW